MEKVTGRICRRIKGELVIAGVNRAWTLDTDKWDLEFLQASGHL